MTYHVISFDLSTSHVMSHMTDPNAQLPMPTFPLWFTDMITGLGRLPNWDIRSTSYLGNTPIWKPQNSNDWKTQWPDHDTCPTSPMIPLTTSLTSCMSMRHWLEPTVSLTMRRSRWSSDTLLPIWGSFGRPLMGTRIQLTGEFSTQL